MPRDRSNKRYNNAPKSVKPSGAEELHAGPRLGLEARSGERRGREHAPSNRRNRQLSSHPSALDESGFPRSNNKASRSVPPLVAALIEPMLATSLFLLATVWFNGRLQRFDVVLCVAVFALTFPARGRLEKVRSSMVVDLALTWITLLSVLTFVGYVTGSLPHFNFEVLATWALVTPVVQWAVRSSAGHPEARRTAVMVGAGPLGATVARALQERSGRRIDFIGWFDDRASDRVRNDATTRVLRPLEDLAPFIREHRVSDVYITLPLSSHPRIVRLLENVESTTASIYYIPDALGIRFIQSRLKYVNGIPILGICETPFTGLNKVIKRVTDVVLASAILTIISPLLLGIAVGVKLTSPGPIIFRQRRNGLNGDEITVYKFRTMTTQDDGPVVTQATKADPRITRFGAFLRHTSLDELPQFFNVLQGDMSIVGPRPHAVAHNEQYRQIVSSYMVRHKVKPGITGWAQVNGLRGETDTVEKMKARVEYDLAYLQNWSLWLDLKIILRTVRLVFFDRHAY